MYNCIIANFPFVKESVAVFVERFFGIKLDLHDIKLGSERGVEVCLKNIEADPAMLNEFVLKGVNLHNNDLVDKAYQKFEECYTRDMKDLRRLRDAEAKLRKIQMKIENLTEMRVNGEITKQEFSSMKNKINGEMLMAEKEEKVCGLSYQNLFYVIRYSEDIL